MNRLVLCRKHLGLLGLGLGMLLTGCNSLTGNKLNISEEFPKNLVASNIGIFKKEITEQNKNIDIEELSSCMAPLIEGKGLTGKMNLIPALFDNLGKISPDNALIDFSDDIFQSKNLFNFFKGKGIADFMDTDKIDAAKVFKELVGNEQGNTLSNLLPLKHLLNFDLTKAITDGGINDPKISQLALITELYFNAYFSSAIGDIKQIVTDKPESKKNDLDSGKEPGFVARDGSKYSFSGLSKADGKLSIDHNQIGADIVRIFLEAFRDTYYQIPVSPDSTLAQNKDKLNKQKFNVDIFVDGKTVWHINKDKEDDGKEVSITKEKFNEIETDANRSEAAIATAVGKAIRGGFVGSLNNEALAKTIETAAGVISRQTTERFKWCSAVAQKNVQKTSEVNSVLLTGL